VVGAIHVPEVYDRDAAATQIIQCVVARWKTAHPKDYAAFKHACDEYRKSLTPGGWSKETGDMRVGFLLAPYVQWSVARIVKDTSWNFREERLINAYLREVPCARLDGVMGTPGHSAINRADKDRKWGA
jgi:hypothetical protein